jgi:DNA-binding NarL/FixJ family response regulator
MVQIAIVDHHLLVAKGIAKIIEAANPNYKVVNISKNAHEFLSCLKSKKAEKIDLVVINYDMLGLNGIDLCYLLNRDFPTIKKIGLGNIGKQEKVIGFLYHGCKAFITKTCDETDLIAAIENSIKNEFYLNRFVMPKMIKHIKHKKIEFNFPLGLRDNHYFFIKLCNTNITYKSMAEILSISENTLHKIQQRVFDKFSVHNRTELSNVAITNDLFANYFLY